MYTWGKQVGKLVQKVHSKLNKSNINFYKVYLHLVKKVEKFIQFIDSQKDK